MVKAGGVSVIRVELDAATSTSVDVQEAQCHGKADATRSPCVGPSFGTPQVVYYVF